MIGLVRSHLSRSCTMSMVSSMPRCLPILLTSHTKLNVMLLITKYQTPGQQLQLFGGWDRWLAARFHSAYHAAAQFRLKQLRFVMFSFVLRQLGIQKLDVVTDNEATWAVTNGIMSVFDNKCECVDDHIACIQIAKAIKLRKIRLAPREMLAIPNSLARADSVSGLLNFMQDKADYLWGNLFLRIRQSDYKIKKAIAEGRKEAASMDSFAGGYHLMVMDQAKDKAAALQWLIVSLSPLSVVALSDVFMSAFMNSLRLQDDYLCVTGGDNWQASHTSGGSKGTVLFLTNEEIPQLPSGVKTLVVAFGNVPVRYSEGQDISKVAVVRILTDEQEKSPGSREVDPSLFVFFKFREPQSVQQRFKVMTYKLGGSCEKDQRQRINSLDVLINSHDPDIICFKDVTPEIHLYMQKFTWWKNYRCSMSHPKAVLKKGNYTLQLCKLDAAFEMKTFGSSTMHREWCKGDIKLKDMKKEDGMGISITPKTKLVLATWASSSDDVYELFNELELNQNAILAGDMGCAVNAGKFTLPNENWIHVWDGPRTGGCSSSIHSDYILCKLADYKLDSAQRIGEGMVVTISRMF